MKLLGYVLVSTGLMVSILAFTTAYGYTPGAGLAWNLANAKTFRLTDTVTIECLHPEVRQPGEPLIEFRKRGLGLGIPGCPTTAAEWRQRSIVTRTSEIFSLPLGGGLAGAAAFALVGVGLMTFGGPQRPR